MLVSEILDEVKEAVGKCDTAFALRTLTRAVQLLANKGLIDPLIGYFDFTVSDNYFVALPRDVKTPLRININKKPAFSRARLYEFHINSEGTTDADDLGLSWADRGYSPIQDEKKLPGALGYKVSHASDNGKTITVTGLDEAGRQQTETLTGNATTPVAGSVTFHKIERVVREATNYEAFLWCNGTNVCAQYYADETIPEYRVIKLSRTASHVRVMFRRKVYSVRTVDDFIPMHSEMAVIQACKAVRFLATDQNDKAAAALAMAEMFLKEEQSSREEHNAIAGGQEDQPAIDSAIFMRDGVVVGDVYDAASRIFGPVGRRALFDRITTAIELLSHKGQWDSRIGVVDVFTADNTGAVNYHTPLGQTWGLGLGYYVLPRHVETPLAISYRCGQTIPRNRWFEFHMNGDGAMSDFSSCGTWDDAGEVCLMRPLPLDGAQEPKDRSVEPTYLVAVPDDAQDNETEVRIYGFERDANDRDIEVWRNGERGWLCPCVKDSYDPGAGAPRWTAVERITKGESKSFIRLFATTYTPAVVGVPGTPGTPGTPAINGTPEVAAVDATALLDLDAPYTPPDTFAELSAQLPEGFEITSANWPVFTGNITFHAYFNGTGIGGWQVNVYDANDTMIVNAANIFGSGSVEVFGGDYAGLVFQMTLPFNSTFGGDPSAEGQFAGRIVRTQTAFVPAVPASDVTTANDPAVTVDSASYTNGFASPTTVSAYLSVTQGAGFQSAQLYADAEHAVELAAWSQEDTLDQIQFAAGVNEGDWDGISAFTLFLSGFVAMGELTGAEFVITRTVQQDVAEVVEIPEIPEIPAVAAFWTLGEQYGFWYPDECEPRYRMIRLPHRAPRRIRLLFRKRTPKVTSLTEPIPLRSRYAIEQMMRGLKAGEQDPNATAAFEAQALRYLREERINLGPTSVGIFQFDASTMPGFTGNVQ